MPNQKLISYEKWKAGTARALHVRSKELQALDAALKAYDKACAGWSDAAASASMWHEAVSKAFDAWKASKGGGDLWKKTSRDGNQMFTLLNQQLNGIEDTDKALGVANFMTEDMIHARLGALFLFSRLECDDSIFSVAVEGAVDLTTSSLDYAGVNYNQTVVAGAKSAASEAAKQAENRIRSLEGKPRLVKSTQLLQSAPPPTNERLLKIWTAIRDKVLEYAHKIIEAIRAKLNSIRDSVMTAVEHPGEAAIANLPGILRKLVDVLTSRFLAAAAPFIGAGLDVAKGIVNTLDAGVTKFQDWLSSQDVVLASGHITVIVESIKRAMWMSLGSGLYDLLKGGLNLGMQFASSGAASIVSLVSSIIETVVKAVWKIIEISRLRKFFDEARELWDKHKEPNSLHRRPIAFNQWFKGYSLSLPVLPVLALNTGVTGNKMLFLQMLQSDNRVVSQAQFDKGVTYLDGLKDWGSSYLKECGFSIKSEDKMVSGLLSMAQSQAAPLSTKGQLWQAVCKFLN
jgi:hypothetical protein